VAAKRDLLLDTHVWIWAVEGRAEQLRPAVLREIERAATDGRVYVSAISVWEIGMLVQKGRLTLARDLASWIAESRRPPGVIVAALTAPIALDAALLPAFVQGDPADRIIAATARALSARLVTCDERLLTYGATGHVLTLSGRVTK